MSRQAQYTVLTLDLTNAGSEVIDGPWGVMRFLDATDAAGDVASDSLIQVRSERGGEDAPFRLGFGFFARGSRRWVLSWEAQTGVTAKIGLADQPETLDWDADPPAKLVTGSIKLKGGSTLGSVADVSIAAATTASAIAANSTRRYVEITNLSTNAREVRIGDSAAGAAEGREVLPGDFARVETTAEVFAYNPHSAAQSLSVVEVAD